jgi:hypothetical protein
MQRVHVRKKRPTILPWVIGFAVLVVVIWSVTSLLAAPQDEDENVVVPAPADTVVPSPIPAPPHPVPGTGAAALESLAPVGEEHVGESVRAEGEVVATGTTGFWMVVGSEMIRVDSGLTVRRGQSVTVDGILAAAEDERTDQIFEEVVSRNPQAENWRVVTSVKLVDRLGPEPTGA